MRHSRRFRILEACLALLVALPAGAGAELDRSRFLPQRPGDRAVDVHPGWTMLWNDEFDEPGPPNSDYWSHEVNCWGGGNNESQCYTDRLDNAYVGHDGLLHIVAREEVFSGPLLQDDDPRYPGPSVTRNYTSARLRTRNKADWKYGRIEVRAQVPGGQGMWPAIWMLPTDWKYGGWPSSGEIDIFEAVNLRRGDFRGWGNLVHGTLHYGLPWPQWENHGRAYRMRANPADGFHEYAIEWDADQIRWYVDGKHYQTQTSQGWYNYIWGGQRTGFVVPNERAPFDQRFHLLLNVAVGGDWPGPPDSGWDADREMLVDYVRVYQCPGRFREPAPGGSGPRWLTRGGPEGGGTTCATIDPTVRVHTDAGTPGINDYVVYDDGLKALGSTDLVPDSFAVPGATVDSELQPNGAWEIEFARTGPLVFGDSLGHVSVGSAGGFSLDGGTGWTNNGEIEFDIKVESIDPETRLFVKMDSGNPNAGFVEIKVGPGGRKARRRRLANQGEPPELLVPGGEWHHVAVQVADLLASRNPGEAPLDLHNIQDVFVLESTGPARVRVNGIRLQCAFNTEPEWWQPDKTCGLTPSAP